MLVDLKSSPIFLVCSPSMHNNNLTLQKKKRIIMLLGRKYDIFNKFYFMLKKDNVLVKIDCKKRGVGLMGKMV